MVVMLAMLGSIGDNRLCAIHIQINPLVNRRALQKISFRISLEQPLYRKHVIF